MAFSTKRRPVTIHDVAEAAGVSAGTVSRAMNNSPLVRPETKARVLHVAQELRYVPNIFAQRLSTGKALSISIVVPFFTRPSVTERLNGAISLLSNTQYDLIIHNIETPQERHSCFTSVINRQQADGILFFSLSPSDEEAEIVAQSSACIVFIDASHTGLSRFHQVFVDDVAGGRQAVEYLISLGHQRIAFLTDTLDTPFRFTASRDRYIGYRGALEDAGIPFRPEYVVEGEFGRWPARQLAIQLLSLPEPPTAIFATSDTQAIGVLEAARELEISVPDHLSVIGYDDIEIADILGISTIHQPLYHSGRRGVQLLLSTLEDPDTPACCEVLPTELVVRATTASAP